MPQPVTIEAVGIILPPHRISSESLEAEIAGTMDRLGFPRGLLQRLTGIQERRFWDPGVQPSEVATEAARQAIDAAGIDPQRIGCIINTSVSKDYIEPSIASLVHGNLGLSAHCRNFDIGNACLGFLDAINVLELMLQAGQIDYGLIVNGESAREPIEGTVQKLRQPSTTREDFRLKFANLTLGSGAAAMVLTSRERSRTGHTVNASFSYARTSQSRLCVGQRDGGEVDASRLLEEGVSLAAEAWPLAAARIPGWSDDQIDLYIPHQVSLRNTEALARRLKIPLHKLHLNVQTLGNTGPAAIPITLKMAEEAGRIRPGDHVALLGIGSGLNCTAMSLRW